MPPVELLRSRLRRDPAVRRVVRAWRELTGGTGHGRELARRTLLACSGGGDSCGLVLALWAASSQASDILVVGHVLHDLRPRDQAAHDAGVAASLAARLSLPFECVEVRVPRHLNAEAAARSERYRALEDIAARQSCTYVATAHHAEDQLETMLMALLRGAGLDGLSAAAPSRAIRPRSRIRLIRPALGVERSDLRRVCELAEQPWAEDATNQDLSRLRAALRTKVVPELMRLRPHAARRAASAADQIRHARALIRQAALLIEHQVGHDGTHRWLRAALAREPRIVVGELLRRSAMAAGGRGDALTSRALRPLLHAINSHEGHARQFPIGGVVFTLDRQHLTLQPGATKSA